MTPWLKVVTEPLGLVGFALFLLFAFVGKINKDDKRRWLAPVAFGCAVVALLGGLGLAYLEAANRAVQARPAATQPRTTKPAQPSTQQTSNGSGSPNINGVTGDVVISIDQSTGKSEVKQIPPKKTRER